MPRRTGPVHGLRWFAAALSVAAIIAATLLPGHATPAAQLPPHWCLQCGDRWLADAICNVVLFLPLGGALTALLRRSPDEEGRVVAISTAIGLLLSLSVEWLQSIGVPPGRSPALADVLANTGGAVLGSWGWRYGRQLVALRGWRAGAFAVLWGGGVLAIFWGTAAASQRRLDAARDRNGTPHAELAVRPSRFTYAPGYGWYGGRPIDATVNGTRVAHQGFGPIVMVSAAPSETLQVAVRTRGRDAAMIRRAVAYLHLANDTTAQLVITQRDRDAVVAVRRLASDMGLAMPEVRVANVFRAFDQPIDTTTIVVRAARDRITLTASRGGWRNVAEVRLSPVIGWAMLQSVITMQSPYAWVVEAAWLITLLAPLGWWSGRTGGWGTPSLALGGVGIGLLAPAHWIGVAPPTDGEAILSASIFLVTFALGRWALSGRARSAHHRAAGMFDP